MGVFQKVEGDIQRSAWLGFDNWFIPWLAGYIDGEGTIGINKRKPTSLNRTYYTGYRAYLSITSTKEESIDFILRNLKSCFGKDIGSVYRYQSHHPERQKNPVQFSVNRYNDLLGVLVAVSPFLVLKQEQANLCIEYLMSREKVLVKKERIYGSSFSQREVEIYERVKILNKRGV